MNLDLVIIYYFCKNSRFVATLSFIVARKYPSISLGVMVKKEEKYSVPTASSWNGGYECASRFIRFALCFTSSFLYSSGTQ